MPDRTATRLTFNKAWVGRNIYITFEYNGVTYRYPHDEMLEITMNDGIIKGTQNWEG